MKATPYEEGDPNSKICLLLEAPGRTEMRLGRPVVGLSGQLLEQCMHAAGVIRRECYILNVFEGVVHKDKGGSNIYNEDGDILYTPKSGFTDLGEEYSRRTRQRLENCKANVIVPMGGTALNFVWPDHRVTKWRGSVIQAASGQKLTPTLHPAASLRGNFLWRHLITSDLAKAKKQSLFPEYRPPERAMHIPNSINQIQEFIHEIGDETALDIELVNHQIYCICFTHNPNEIMTIPFVAEDGSPLWELEEELFLWEQVEKLLARKDCRKIVMNCMFDIFVIMLRNRIITYGAIEDIMIAHHIIWPDFRMGLDFMTSMHTEEPYYKDEGKQFNKITDRERFLLYNCKDGGVTHEIWNAIQPELDKGYRQTYQETMDMVPIFLFMMLKGIKIDKKNLEETKAIITAEIDQKEQDLEELIGRSLNTNSPKQCNEYFYVTKGIKPYISRATGRPTTDDKALSRIFRKHQLREAKLIQEIRGLKKLKGTYLEVGIDSDDRVRCSFNLRGTVTGRPSSSKTLFGTGMNLQNLHPQFKSFLIADE